MFLSCRNRKSNVDIDQAEFKASVDRHEPSHKRRSHQFVFTRESFYSGFKRLSLIIGYQFNSVSVPDECITFSSNTAKRRNRSCPTSFPMLRPITIDIIGSNAVPPKSVKGFISTFQLIFLRILLCNCLEQRLQRFLVYNLLKSNNIRSAFPDNSRHRIQIFFA